MNIDILKYGKIMKAYGKMQYTLKRLSQCYWINPLTMCLMLLDKLLLRLRDWRGKMNASMVKGGFVFGFVCLAMSWFNLWLFPDVTIYWSIGAFIFLTMMFIGGFRLDKEIRDEQN